MPGGTGKDQAKWEGSVLVRAKGKGTKQVVQREGVVERRGATAGRVLGARMQSGECQVRRPEGQRRC